MIRAYNFNEFLNEAGGQAPGQMELLSTSYEEAVQFALERNFDPENKISGFKENYELGQKKAGKGYTKRKNMPVIDKDDVKQFQYHLEQGYIDLNDPFAPINPAKNPEDDPFPEGLDGEQAEKWLNAGLKDGNKKDDKIDVNKAKTSISELTPIQKQIYYDKSISNIIKFGINETIDFTSSSLFIVSSDLRIIDGHHRWLGGILLDPNIKVNILMIDYPISDLLPLARSYGDAIGNKRNA